MEIENFYVFMKITTAPYVKLYYVWSGSFFAEEKSNTLVGRVRTHWKRSPENDDSFLIGMKLSSNRVKETLFILTLTLVIPSAFILHLK